jgi:hypothetical protein
MNTINEFVASKIGEIDDILMQTKMIFMYTLLKDPNRYLHMSYVINNIIYTMQFASDEYIDHNYNNTHEQIAIVKRIWLDDYEDETKLFSRSIIKIYSLEGDMIDMYYRWTI